MTTTPEPVLGLRLTARLHLLLIRDRAASAALKLGLSLCGGATIRDLGELTAD